MKGILLVLLVITAVFFVAVESRRGSKPRKGRVCAKACLNCTDRGICVECKAGFRLNPETNQCEKDCGKNCVKCDGRRCLECDNGFARITITLRRFSKTICKPCAKQISIKRKGVDKDDSKCAAVNTTEAPCPKKCAACENGICLKCDKGFALFSSAKRDSKFCIPCARATKAGKFANSNKSQCPVNTTEAPCPKKCAACENGICLKCDKGFALFSSAKRDSKFCIPCARATKAGKFASSDKSQCPAAETCRKGFKRNPKTNKCEKKKARKGGNKKPNKQGGKRRPKTPAPLKKL